MTFIHHKSLQKRFWRIALDENDLVRLATIVSNSVANFEGNLVIEVLSADGEDKFRSNEPNFFFDDNLPRLISEIRISYRHYNAPISCDIQITTGSSGCVDLSVDGEDPTIASGLFRELTRKIESRELGGIWLAKRLDSNLSSLAISILTAVAIYCAFDFLLFIADVSAEGFKGSTIRSFIGYIGWICVFVGFVFGGFSIERSLKCYFSSVHFRGRISDPWGKRRARLIWIDSALILPILLNVITSMISDLLSRFGVK